MFYYNQMNYEKLSHDTFEKALEHFNKLEAKENITRIEAAQLCILCRNFEETFERWISCAKNMNEAAQTAVSTYHNHIKSTPLHEFLSTSYGKRFGLCMKGFSSSKPAA